MSQLVGVVFFTFFTLRIFTPVISSRNERKLRKMRAVEFGKKNSAVLIAGHVLYYFTCIVEGFNKGAFFADATAYAGLGIYVFSIVILYYVIYSLRHVWTVKLIVAPKGYHTINDSFLFKYVRHPNYYLNIIPELIGTALVFHAWYSLAIGFTLYLIPLVIRIVQEERVMKEHFETY
jgi:isoprenylcysteine carboxyl methyltransferase (ICMT) family protein YpbQ